MKPSVVKAKLLLIEALMEELAETKEVIKQSLLNEQTTETELGELREQIFGKHQGDTRQRKEETAHRSGSEQGGGAERIGQDDPDREDGQVGAGGTGSVPGAESVPLQGSEERIVTITLLVRGTFDMDPRSETEGRVAMLSLFATGPESNISILSVEEENRQ